MIFLAFFFVFLTGMSGFKEACLYSRQGSDGVKKYEPKFDHLPWILERSLWWGVMATSFLFLGDTTELWVMTAFWILQFMFIHTIAYNGTMIGLKVEGYTSFWQTKTKTTAWIDPPMWVRTTLFLIGVLGFALFEFLY